MVFWFSFFLGFLGLLCLNLPISVASGSVAEFHFHQENIEKSLEAETWVWPSMP
jgi:hypothetical protein